METSEVPLQNLQNKNQGVIHTKFRQTVPLVHYLSYYNAKWKKFNSNKSKKKKKRLGENDVFNLAQILGTTESKITT